MAEAGAQTERLVKARILLEEGRLEESLVLLHGCLLDAPADTDALDVFALVLDEAGRQEASRKIDALSQSIKHTVSGGSLPFGDKDMVKPLYEAAFAMMDLRLFELSIKLLERCVDLSPDEPVPRYELAFSLMSLKRFDEAIPHFKEAAKVLNDFDTNLSLGVCYMITRDLKQARACLDKLAVQAQDEDEKKELAHRRIVMKRMEEIGNRATLTARDWLYTLYGSVLLHPMPSHQENEDIKCVAGTLLVLRGVIEGLRMDFETIEFYNPLSKPLARLMSELMELPMDSYKGPDRPDRALLVVAWAGDLIGPHNAFVEVSERRSLFAYALPAREPLPVLPEIIGCVCEQQPLPWNEETSRNALDDIVAKILEKARHIEHDPEILKQTQDAVEYYHLKREHLMLGNNDGFPERPEYTAEIPL